MANSHLRNATATANENEFVVSVGSPIHASPSRFAIAALSPLPETACYPDEIRVRLGPLLSFHAGFSYTPADPTVRQVDHGPLVGAVRTWWDRQAANARCDMFHGPGFRDIEYRLGEVTRHVTVTDAVSVGIRGIAAARRS